MTDEELIALAVTHKLGRTMKPIGMETGDVFVTDQSYRTGELLAFATAVAEAERKRCAWLARNGCLVPPDGGSPTEDERLLCEEIERCILGTAPGMSAPPAPAKQPKMKTEFCWLVELFERGGNSLGRYHTGYNGLHNQSRMTSSAHEARRYTKKEGAEMVAEALNAHMMMNVWCVVDHGFDAL